MPEQKSGQTRSSCLRIGTFLVIQKILNGYKLPEILEKYLGKKETGLFLDLVAYSFISENNAAQYYPSYAYSHPLFTNGFKRTKNCYPSPVLHALKNTEENEQITMPVSKTIPTDKQKIMKTEISASSRAQEIAGKMMELRKQKRNLDRTLIKCEQELSEIFDDSNTDSMEIKMGLLVRRKTNERTEWVIEL